MNDRILVIDDDDSVRDSLMLLLSAEGYEVAATGDVAETLRLLEDRPIDVILYGMGMAETASDNPIFGALRRLQAPIVILMASGGGDHLAVEAIEFGAYACVSKPIDPSELLLTLRNARSHLQLQREYEVLRREFDRTIGDEPIVAASSQTIELLETIERLSEFRAPALLTGERGTGKEVLARAIHAQSSRRREVFLTVECAGTPEAQLESELFGYAKGAVLGAKRPCRGFFGLADGGTLFLDEICELPISTQDKVLRVLQNEEILPLGSPKAEPIDVRILAATSRNLEEQVAAGRFREDLLNRIGASRVHVPALRERRKDIPLLIDHFLARSCRILGKPVRGIADDALERLVAYSWPGNIRELANVIERATLVAVDDKITSRDLPRSVASPSDDPGTPDEDLCLKRARRSVEAEVIRRALRATRGNRTHAAKRLEISHRALLYKIKEYQIRD